MTPFPALKLLMHLQNRQKQIYLLPIRLYFLIININSMSSVILTATVNLISILDSSYQSDSITSMEIAIQAIDEIISASPKIVANNYDKLYALFQLALQPQNQSPLRDLSLIADVIAQIVQLYPSLLRKNKLRFVKLIKANLEVLTKVNFNVKETWMTPPEGFNEDQQVFQDQDTQVTRQMMKIFDQLATALSCEYFLENFKAIAHEWFNANQQDWRYKHAVLMSMSQLGEVVQCAEDIQYFVDCAISCTSHPHPKVRYAMLHAIGQLADDMRPKFQQTYTQKVLPSVISLLQDPVNKVSSHAFASMTNFVENYGQLWRLQPFLQDIVGPIVHFCKNGSSLVKQNSISLLGSLGTINNLFNQNIKIAFQIINNVIVNHAPQGAYKQLINQAFEAASILLQNQNKKYSQPYLNHYVNLFVSYKDKLQPSYKLGVWSRFCLGFQSFIDLSLVYEDILNSAEHSLMNEADYDNEQAINSIQNTVKCFKVAFKPFVPMTVERIKQVLSTKDAIEPKVRQSCYGVLQEIIVSLKPQDPDPQWQNLAKQTLQYFFSQMSSQVSQEHQQATDYTELQKIMQGVRSMINEMGGLFNQGDIINLFTTLMGISDSIEVQIEKLNIQLQELKQEAQDNNQQYQFQEAQDLDKIVVDMRKRLVESLLIIPDVYQSLLKISSSEIKLKILEELVPKINIYVQKQPDIIRYGLYYVDNILQSFQYSEISNLWGSFYNLLSMYATNPFSELRNSSVYGLGVIFQKTPPSLVNQACLISWLEVLWSSLMISYNSSDVSGDKAERKRVFQFAKDNVVSALGKLLRTYYKQHRSILNDTVFNKWLEFLPLNEDKIEGNLQNAYLIEFLMNDPEVILKNAQDLKKVLEIFASFVQKRAKPAFQVEIEKTRHALGIITAWPLFTQSVGFLWQSLSESHKSILSKLTEK